MKMWWRVELSSDSLGAEPWFEKNYVWNIFIGWDYPKFRQMFTSNCATKYDTNNVLQV